jgi:hypothetical protein
MIVAVPVGTGKSGMCSSRCDGTAIRSQASVSGLAMVLIMTDISELDATDFADLCVDTNNHNVAQAARQIRARTSGWPRLTP